MNPFDQLVRLVEARILRQEKALAESKLQLVAAKASQKEFNDKAVSKVKP